MELDMKAIDDDRLKLLKEKCNRIVNKADEISQLMHHRDSADQMSEEEMKRALRLRNSLKEDIHLLHEWVDKLNIL